MIRLFISVVAFIFFSFSKEGEELAILDELIATTQRQLSVQKELKNLISLFQAQQDLFYKGPQTKELASQMVHTALKILQLAEESHSLHLFTPFFIEELKLFAGIANKKTA